MEKIIRTDVDSLVSLVNEEKRISFRDASRRLGVPISTMKDWANFLEEEEIINIEYKFITPYLVSKDYSKKTTEEAKKSAKEETEIFKRKAESTLGYLNKVEAEIDSLKELFKDFGDHFKARIADAKIGFNELKKYKEEEAILNKGILEENENFLKDLNELNKKLRDKQKELNQTQEILFNISTIQKVTLSINLSEMQIIQSTDDLIERRLKIIGQKIDVKKTKEKSQNREIVSYGLSKLETKYSKLKEYINSERQILKKFIIQNESQQARLNSLKKEVIDKITSSNLKLDKSIEDVGEIPKKFKNFLERQDKILRILDTINTNERVLKDNLNTLIKKAKEAEAKGGVKLVEELIELEKAVEDISEKKSFLEGKFKEILNLLTGKESTLKNKVIPKHHKK